MERISDRSYQVGEDKALRRHMTHTRIGVVCQGEATCIDPGADAAACAGDARPGRLRPGEGERLLQVRDGIEDLRLFYLRKPNLPLQRTEGSVFTKKNWTQIGTDIID